MTHYHVVPILLILRFVANDEDLQWGNFFVLAMNRRRAIRIYLSLTKISPLHTYTDLKQPMLNRIKKNCKAFIDVLVDSLMFCFLILCYFGINSFPH